MSPLALLAILAVPALAVAARPTRRQRAWLRQQALRLWHSIPAQDVRYAWAVSRPAVVAAFLASGAVLGLCGVLTGFWAVLAP